MTRFIGIISGKGGVGKTTCVLNLAITLTNFGRHVVAVDGNLATPNLGLSLGIPSFKIDLNDVLDGKGDITNTAYRHISGLMIIPSDIKYKTAGSHNFESLKNNIKLLKDRTEIVLVDSAGGINEEARGVIKAVNDVIVVTTPDLNAVTGALKSIAFAEENGANVLGVIINKVRGESFELSLQNIETILEKPIIAAISNDKKVLESLGTKQPVAYAYPNTAIGKEFKYLASKIIGQVYEDGSGELKEVKLEYSDFFAK